MSGPFLEVKDSYPDIWKKLRKDLGVPDEVVYTFDDLKRPL